MEKQVIIPEKMIAEILGMIEAILQYEFAETLVCKALDMISNQRPLSHKMFVDLDWAFTIDGISEKYPDLDLAVWEYFQDIDSDELI